MKQEPSEAEVLHAILKRLSTRDRDAVLIATEGIIRDTIHLPLNLQALAIGLAGARLQASSCN